MNTILTVALAASVSGLNPDIGAGRATSTACSRRAACACWCPTAARCTSTTRARSAASPPTRCGTSRSSSTRSTTKKNQPDHGGRAADARATSCCSGLLQGRGDIAAGNLTITAARAKRVDFSKPIGERRRRDRGHRAGARPSSPRSTTSAGRKCTCAARAATTRAWSAQPAPARRGQAGDAHRRGARRARGRGHDGHGRRGPDSAHRGGRLEGEAVGVACCKRHARPRPELALTDGESIGWAFRPDSPKLAAVVNEFIARIRARARSA